MLENKIVNGDITEQCAVFSGENKVLLGALGYVPIYGAFPVNVSSSTKAKFAYKFIQSNNVTDFANIIFALTKYNSSLGRSAIVAQASAIFDQPSSTYQEMILDFNYPDPEVVPDSGFVMVLTSARRVGAKLFVDDFSLISQFTGINEVKTAYIVKTFPNPATTTLNVTVPDSKAKNVEIFNILGKKVMSTSVSELTTRIDISKLSNGIYTYRILDAGNVMLTSGVFNIAK